MHSHYTQHLLLLPTKKKKTNNAIKINVEKNMPPSIVYNNVFHITIIVRVYCVVVYVRCRFHSILIKDTQTKQNKKPNKTKSTKILFSKHSQAQLHCASQSRVLFIHFYLYFFVYFILFYLNRPY